MKYAIVLFLLIALNIVTLFWALPAIQQDVTNHYTTGEPFMLAYYTVALLALLYAIFGPGHISFKLLVGVFAINLIFWGYTISNLECPYCLEA